MFKFLRISQNSAFFLKVFFKNKNNIWFTLFQYILDSLMEEEENQEIYANKNYYFSKNSYFYAFWLAKGFHSAWFLYWN